MVLLLFQSLFYDLSFRSFEKIYQALKIVFNLISKHLEVRQKYSATRRIFNSLLGVWNGVIHGHGLSCLMYYKTPKCKNTVCVTRGSCTLCLGIKVKFAYKPIGLDHEYEWLLHFLSNHNYSSQRSIFDVFYWICVFAVWSAVIFPKGSLKSLPSLWSPILRYSARIKR